MTKMIEHHLGVFGLNRSKLFFHFKRTLDESPDESLDAIR